LVLVVPEAVVDEVVSVVVWMLLMVNAWNCLVNAWMRLEDVVVVDVMGSMDEWLVDAVDGLEMLEVMVVP
jgi:hypothetical protein